MVYAVAGYVNGAYTFKLVDERLLPGGYFLASVRKQFCNTSFCFHADVIASMPAGATSHVYSVSGAPFRDLSSRLAAAVNSQAMTLSTQSSPAAAFYNKNGYVWLVFSPSQAVARLAVPAFSYAHLHSRAISQRLIYCIQCRGACS